jgi:hypothetical protein
MDGNMEQEPKRERGVEEELVALGMEPAVEPSLAVALRRFLLGERDRTIARLRQIERLLGMEQTIPERRR